MAKNIVFCADGTWNGPGEPDHDDPNSPATNVFKLFLALDGADTPGTTRLAKEQERTLTAADGSITQIAKYLDGVGDSENFLVKMIGGAMGAGLITRIVRGYTFVSRNYVAGDKIYLVGFSRGAYTARALAGLISAKGLLDATKVPLDDKEGAYRKGAAVWYQWRREVLAAAGNWTLHLQEFLLDLPGFLSAPPVPAQLAPAPIEAVAVWDTVGSLGIPAFDSHMVEIDLFQFADRKLSRTVAHGLHAIAVDEQRDNFTPTPWEADPGRIIQVLFPGAHADVGGGYTTSNNESGLSDGALQWLGRELKRLGLVFSAAPVIVHKPDPRGTAHRPWLGDRWKFLPHQQRALPPGLGLSKSVIDRMNAGSVIPAPGAPPEPYRPANVAAYLAGTAAAAGVEVVDGSQDWP